MTARMFPLGQILSVTTGRLLCPDFTDLHGILSYLTGDDVFIHQIPRAVDTCAPHLLRQYPGLQGWVPAEDATTGQIIQWLARARNVFGPQLPVEPLPPGAWEHRDPLKELAERIGPDRTIQVTIPESDQT